MTTVSIATLGCKVNQFESEALGSSLEEKGYLVVPFGEPADIVIINTCTVTQRADFQSRQMVRRGCRTSPDSLLIVTGCGAETEPERLAKIDGVKHVLGNVEKSRLPDLLPQIREGGFPTIRVSEMQPEDPFTEIPVPNFRRHTRAFLKIQDGCDSCCSYCIVPRARGHSRSLPPNRITQQVSAFKAKGYKEVVLTGIHIGGYGRDLAPPLSLEELLKRLEVSESPSRIRLSSVEPLDFSPGLISFLEQSAKVCPHLHIPIQSGDDGILKKMNRNYDGAFVAALVERLHRAIPDLCIGADVIAGFPGETEGQFDRTRRLIEGLPFSYLHVFPFSMRKGTTAYALPDPVDPRDVRTRAGRLRELGKEKRQSFYRRFLNRELSVLLEERIDKKTGACKGISRNYVPVLLSPERGAPAPTDWINHEVNVTITEVSEGAVRGRLLEEACERRTNNVPERV